MDFSLSAEQEAFRAKVQTTVNSVVDDDMRRAVVSGGVAHDAELSSTLGEAGLLRDAVPGPDTDPVLVHLLFSELEKAGAPHEGIAVNLLVAGVLRSAGTEAQCSLVADPLLSGSTNICIGYSEPNAGSDLTRVSTRSWRVDGGWTISGQKIWTTLAQDSEWMFALTRTVGEEPAEQQTGSRRRAETMFLIPMKTDGVRVDPIYMMGGERVNSVFLDEVFVTDEWRVGEVNRAWDVMALALSLERGVLGNSELAVALLAASVQWFAATGDVGARLLEDPVVREAIVVIAVENQVGSLLGLRAAVDRQSPSGVAGSQVKVFVSERYVRAARLLQDLCGPAGVLAHTAAHAAGGGVIDHHVHHSPLTRIAGGTTEINRNNIAERLLGLPRTR